MLANSAAWKHRDGNGFYLSVELSSKYESQSVGTRQSAPDQSLISLKSRTLEKEIRAWDYDGTLQSLHEVLIEMKRREVIDRWRLIKNEDSRTS
jgi:hypothetical protein